MPPPDAPGSIIPTSAPDEETRAAAEALEVLQRQQPTAGLPEGSSLLTPPGEADYFEGERLIELMFDNLKEEGRFAVHLSPSHLHRTHQQVRSPP